ncbi:MAG: ABC transporter ATP-binding protein [Candidatus Dormiibacterota bacterium]
MPDPLIELDHVSQVFKTPGGPVRALDDVNLAVDPGQVLCLVGESGSGKTTSARAAAGMYRPTAGTVRFRGADIWHLDRSGFRTFRREVQYVHQDPYASLNPVHSVLSLLAAPLQHHRVTRGRARTIERAAELLTQVDLTPPENYLFKYPHQLSGGQRQRVSVARALTLDPQLLIADEATSMLDVSIRVSLLNTLRKLGRELGVGFLFITHDLAVAKYFAWGGHVAVMYLGRIVEFGPAPQIVHRPAHPYTRALIAALPEPDPDAAGTAEPFRLKSAELPSLTALPDGCTFHPRCPLAEVGLCDREVPALEATEAGRSAACHVVARDVAVAAQGTGA